VKILPVTLFKKLVLAFRQPPVKLFRQPPVILKIVPKAGLENMYCTQEKLTNEREGKPEQKFDAAFRTIFRISKCFQRRHSKT
jgi:hypothetical protein